MVSESQSAIEGEETHLVEVVAGRIGRGRRSTSVQHFDQVCLALVRRFGKLKGCRGTELAAADDLMLAPPLVVKRRPPATPTRTVLGGLMLGIMLL